MVGRRHDKTGRSTGAMATSRFAKQNRPPQGEGFVWFTRQIMRSSAFRAMSLNARKLVDRVLIEHMDHGGAQNGELIVTYADLVDWGIRRNSIPPAIAEVVALGILEHRPGRASHIAGKGHPQVFRISWLPTGDEPPSTKWCAFTTIEQANKVAKAARACGTDARHNAKRDPAPKI